MRLIDLKMLSGRTSLSVFTLRKYLKMGLPHYRIGRKILINPEEFEAWLKQFRRITGPDHKEIDRIVNETLRGLEK